ncbi:MAG: F0F1 ATP synthase subunit A, partial [Flavobacteriaceae bacterium]|nr:F0F1 ATP synthase subunit A [Flavobacteriaceae bacterium]
MHSKTFKAFLTIFFLSFFATGFAGSKEPVEGDEPFDTNELIFHHITDSHGFHVAGD